MAANVRRPALEVTIAVSLIALYDIDVIINYELGELAGACRQLAKGQRRN